MCMEREGGDVAQLKAPESLLGLDCLLQPIQALLELLHRGLELPHLLLQPGHDILEDPELL